MPHSLHLSRQQESGTRARRASHLDTGIAVLAYWLCVAAHAAAQTTQPAPVPGCIGTFATALVQGGMAPCTLHVDATELPLAHGRPLTALYEWDFGDPVDLPPSTQPNPTPRAAAAANGASPDRP